MTKEDEADGVLGKLNFNSGTALVCIALGITILALIPYQVEEPPVFFGQSSSGISPKLFPRDRRSWPDRDRDRLPHYELADE